MFKELHELTRLNSYNNLVDFRLPPEVDYLIYKILEKEDKMINITNKKNIADAMCWLLNDFLFFGPNSKLDKSAKASYIGACYLLDINNDSGPLSDLVYIRENYGKLAMEIESHLDEKLYSDATFSLKNKPGSWLLLASFDRMCNVIWHQYSANSYDTILQQSINRDGNYLSILHLTAFAKVLGHFASDGDFNKIIKTFKLCNF